MATASSRRVCVGPAGAGGVSLACALLVCGLLVSCAADEEGLPVDSQGADATGSGDSAADSAADSMTVDVALDSGPSDGVAGQDGGVDPDAGDAAGDDADVGPAPVLWVPIVGSYDAVPEDCGEDSVWLLPSSLAGPALLGAAGIAPDDVRNPVAWNNASVFVTPWISDNSDERPSVRVRPLLAPAAAECYRATVAASISDSGVDLDVLFGALSPALDAENGFGARTDVSYVSKVQRPATDAPVISALRGLWSVPNPLRAPTDPRLVAPTEQEWRAWQDALAGALTPSSRAALADAIVAIGEAALLYRAALPGSDVAPWRTLFDAHRAELYLPAFNWTNAFMSPVANDAPQLTLELAGDFQRRPVLAAARRLTASIAALEAALRKEPPVTPLRLDIPTEYGRVVLNLDGADDAYAAGELHGAALVVDAGGDDSYAGGVAVTDEFWMGASVLIDLAGDDVYGPGVPDVGEPDVKAVSTLNADNAMTQGFGLFGLALLVDSTGDDRYLASANAQGAAAFGYGLLWDRGGTDYYGATILSQGVATFGLGVLVDEAGDDSYALYAAGQGAGRPGGHGLLLDVDGDDTYLALYNDDAPELPEPGYAKIYVGASGYTDDDGESHYINAARGVGWGYRGDWNPPGGNWGGGFGAFFDWGEGNDTHYADCLSLGQGFVYGMGLFYDHGGDDYYRSFWWAYGSGTHMGTGVFWENGGNDDYHATRASATLGHDTGVSWFFDVAGDDYYSGALNYGRSLTNGLAFFFDHDGVDTYELQVGNQTNENYSGFGAVHDALAGLVRLGIFADLGGDEDNYMTVRPDVGNNMSWITPPTGDTADPALHWGLGLDE